MNLNLLDALERADIESRPDRAERIKWLGALEQYSVAFSSNDIESPTLLQEAKKCFKLSLDIAAVLTASGYIEMTLADELKAAGRSLKKPTLGIIIEEIRKHQIPNLVLSQNLLKNLCLLVERRNAYAHRKEAYDQEHTLGSRLIAEKKHPRALGREDAELAMRVMYELFYATLR
ncbi:hypothetical protein FQK02_08555 [Xanthomonas vasicola]|uniref:Uncharacterized protein n=1 Tax=Xanthomonas vasicola pv. vasculorum NCPPB 890 TaxID=1184265 RepID=A0A836P5W4_XANVA|nr:hypothetical protein [Xanthomonas vasicola]KFA22679.1 hypothetical protein KW5_0123065 [Xanthomonas vasicola pv. vasculorum NCPPB 1326]KFA33492.1 hypothetical protein KWG_0104810 [Xanthomonas vasicola pv. vasculorum NCPPB 1381]MBV6745040.1 hypothetical protein [Xanthomonas vasicola pv. vasculorum NCPPB 890]MBV6892573.1 hypothetical protein [Xanthomonas vasicola pv. vasculorum]MDO6948626.1 hypothetical protein [Xanthomonas vasicola]